MKEKMNFYQKQILNFIICILKKIIKNCEKLPNKIKISLENGKIIDNKINKLNSLINDYIKINEIINKSNDTIITKIKLIIEGNNKFLKS